MKTRLKRTGGRTAGGLLLTLWILAANAPAAPWVQTTSLPDGWSDHGLNYYANFLYLTGGQSQNNGVDDGTNVFYAQVHSDGTIGSWNKTTPLPVACSDHNSVIVNGYLFVLGGISSTPTTQIYAANAVYRAKINSDGSLAAWQSTIPLPTHLSYASAAVWNNTIYVVGGELDLAGLDNRVWSAKIQSDGSYSGWTAQASLPTVIYTQSEVANGFLYVVGGINNADPTNTVYYSKINTDGTLAGWNQTTPMPKVLSSFGVVVVGGRIFAMAGSGNTGLSSAVFTSVVNGDGTLSSWSTNTSLPQPLGLFGTIASDSYIFVTGGLNNSGYRSEVYSMALPAPPATPQLVARSFTNGNFQLQLASTTNTGFGLLASTNLSAWTNISWGFIGTNGKVTLTDSNAARFPRRFYRAYWPLP